MRDTLNAGMPTDRVVAEWDLTSARVVQAAGRLIREISLPDGAVVAMVTRERDIIPPRGSTRLLPGDHAFVVLRPDVRQLVDRAFAPGSAESPEPLPPVEFPLSPRTRVADDATPLPLLEAAAYRLDSWGTARAAARQARDLGSRRAPATTEDENAIARERDWQIAANEALVRARRHESEAQRIEREASEMELRLTAAGMDCGG
mgnify:CR=1 FL=1